MQTTPRQSHIPPMSSAPAGFSIERDLPEGFAAFYEPLHREFTPRQQALLKKRHEKMEAAHDGRLPDHLPPSEATQTDWKIDFPAWSADQRNQMTGPADDAELVVKLLNSGAPGVMLDVEDSMANSWEHTLLGIDNLVAGLYGELTYEDKKRGRTVGINPSKTVIWNRVRGLHLSQAGVYPEITSASLFDLALLAYKLDLDRLSHLHPEIRERRGGAVVARCVSNGCESKRQAGGLHQVHGTRRRPRARLRDRRVCL